MTVTPIPFSATSSTRATEVAQKLQLLRMALNETGAAGIRLRGIDWFAWITAGGSNMVLLAAESGIAEVLVTLDRAWILTNQIEFQRLQQEEIDGTGDAFQMVVSPWAIGEQTDAFVQTATRGGIVLSDRPTADEFALPPYVVQQRWVLQPTEVERYRQVGRLASEAMTEVMQIARPDWTEVQLAGAGSKALWERGLHPALILVAGERRLPLYRHPLPTGEPIGQIAMMVFCARGAGLYANLTRFVSFKPLSVEEQSLHQQVREVEAIALEQCRPEVPLHQMYQTFCRAYDRVGQLKAMQEHHQGGVTGYLSREIVATPSTTNPLAANMAVAWNPSLVGAKIEDTFLIGPEGTFDNLTFDPNWPSVEVQGRSRPVPLESSS